MFASFTLAVRLSLTSHPSLSLTHAHAHTHTHTHTRTRTHTHTHTYTRLSFQDDFLTIPLNDFTIDLLAASVGIFCLNVIDPAVNNSGICWPSDRFRRLEWFVNINFRWLLFEHIAPLGTTQFFPPAHHLIQNQAEQPQITQGGHNRHLWLLLYFFSFYSLSLFFFFFSFYSLSLFFFSFFFLLTFWAAHFLRSDFWLDMTPLMQKQLLGLELHLIFDRFPLLFKRRFVAW